MKKILAILLCIFSLLFISCNKVENSYHQDLVNVCFSYSIEQGSMYTKANVFDDIFYTKIESGELVETSYDLTFVETTTGEMYNFTGYWKSNDMVSIKTGKYKVTGKSTASGEFIQNKCSLIFDTEIDIKSTDTNIIIPAKYDCFLLIFEKNNISKVTCNYSGWDDLYINFKTFYELGDYIYGFSYILYDESNLGNRQPFLKVYLNDDKIIKIFTQTINFEFGKYYLYNPVDNNFSIPKMEPGNI